MGMWVKTIHRRAGAARRAGVPAGGRRGCGKAWGSREGPRKAGGETWSPGRTDKGLGAQGGPGKKSRGSRTGLGEAEARGKQVLGDSGKKVGKPRGHSLGVREGPGWA